MGGSDESYDRVRRRASRTRAGSAMASLVLLVVLLACSHAAALDVGEPGDPLHFSLHGFVSQGFILSVRNDYLAANTTRGSFQFSELGLNLTKPLTDKLRVGLQLFAQDLGPTGNYNAKLDWFYLDYRHRDWFGVRAGRLKIPYGLYNEVNDVDAARVPVLLPQSVYPLQTREFMFAQTGFELYGFARSRRAGALDYRVFAGTIFIDSNLLTPLSAPFKLSLNVRYAAGGRLIWETPLPGLRVAASVEAVRMDATAFAGTASVWVHNRSVLAVASAEYQADELVVTAEYSRWHSRQSSNDASNDLAVWSERAYAMTTYRFTPWLQNGLQYGVYYPDVNQREGRDAKQHDLALTLRFDVNSFWLVKLEGHYMEGTAGLNAPLRIGLPISDAARTWGVFFLKTTAYF